MSGWARKAVAATAFGILLAIPALHMVSEMHFSWRQAVIEKAVAPTLTQSEFVRAAEAQGMECEEAQHQQTRVICEWWDFPIYDLIAWVEFVGEGVQAIGYFVDGAKSEDYLVRKEISGP
jgi:hypothetical protein